MTRYTYAKAVDSSALAAAVLAQMGLRLEAGLPTDAVNGFIEVSGGQTKVTFYDQDEPAGAAHSTTFVRTALSPANEATLAAIVAAT